MLTSVSAESATDSLLDSPTNYEASSGNNGGNYATLNPLDSGSNITFSNGNLQFESETTSGTRTALSSIGMSSGKWYFEGQSLQNPNVTAFGIATKNVNRESYLGQNTSGWSWLGEGSLYHNGNAQSNFGGVNGFAVGDIVGIAFDADNGTLKYYKNGSLVGTAYSGLSSDTYFFAVSDTGSTTCEGSVNFGQLPFSYTPPTGHKSLCTTNLPDPTIADPSTAFDIQLWTGTGSQGGSNQTISGYKFSPTFAWIKNRAATEHHALFDQIRGATKVLYSSLTSAEATQGDGLISFTSDGFQLGIDGKVNGNNQAIVGWAWDGGDLATNSAYNQSEVWSNDLTATSSGAYFATGAGAADAFDGELNNSAQSEPNGSTITFSPTGGITVSTSLRVYRGSDSTSNTVNVSVNGGSSTTFARGQWVDLGFTGTLTSLAVSSPSANPGLSAIEVDGKILVDAGVIPVGSLNSSVYNSSQTWSNGWSGDINSSYPGTRSFDGDISTGGVVNTSGTATWTAPGSGIAISSSLRVYGRLETSDGGFTINFSDSSTSTIPVNATKQWHTISGAAGKTITSIVVSKAANGYEGIFHAVEIDGKILLDNGVTPVDSFPSLASTVRANPSAGFSIVTYTGTGSTATIGHGLNAAPGLIIIKSRTNADGWPVYHQSFSNLADNFLTLHNTNPVNN